MGFPRRHGRRAGHGKRAVTRSPVGSVITFPTLITGGTEAEFNDVGTKLSADSRGTVTVHAAELTPDVLESHRRCPNAVDGIRSARFSAYQPHPRRRRRAVRAGGQQHAGLSRDSNCGSSGGRAAGFDPAHHTRGNEVERLINRLEIYRAMATLFDMGAYLFHTPWPLLLYASGSAPDSPGPFLATVPPGAEAVDRRVFLYRQWSSQ